MAGLSKTFSGDFGSFVAGKVWDEIKRRDQENEIEGREGDPAVKQAAKELLRDDPKAINVKDPALRERVSQLFGAGLDVKLIQLDNRIDKLSSSVTALGSTLVDTQKLLVNQNEVLESKFDELLEVFGVELKQRKKQEEDLKAQAEAAGIREGDPNFGSLALTDAMRRGRGSGGGVLGFLLRRAGSAVVKRYLRSISRRFIPRRIRARGRIIRGLPNAWKRNAARSIAGALPGAGGKQIRNIVARETAETAVKRTATRGTGKLLGKKVPGVSLVLGSIFAIERAIKGDFEGAGLEFLSGALATIPGKGTAASFGVDAILFKRDLDNSYEHGTGHRTGHKLTKGGLSELHGQEFRLTETDREDTMKGFMDHLNKIGSALVSISLAAAGSAGAETEVRSQMIKDDLNFDIVNMPFSSDLGRVNTFVDFKSEESIIPTTSPIPFFEGREGRGFNPISAVVEAGSNLIGNLPNPFRRGPSTEIDSSVKLDRQQPGVDFTPDLALGNRALFPGIVVDVGHEYNPNKIGGDNRKGSGYGNYLVIRSTDPVNGQLFDAIYAHFPKGEMKVGVNDTVVWGQQLGRMGWQKEDGGTDERSDIGSTSGPHMSVDFVVPGGGARDKYVPWKTNLLPFIRRDFSLDPTKKPEGGSDTLESTDRFAQHMIKIHEGLRLDAYRDNAKDRNPTVGYGHLIASDSPEDIRNLQIGDTITLKRAEELFLEDYEYHKKEAMRIPGWENASPRQRAALIDLTFNMGPYWHFKFPAMMRAMERGDWDEAAIQLMYADPEKKPGVLSQWMRDVGPRRSDPILSLIKNQGIPESSNPLIYTSDIDDSLLPPESRKLPVPENKGFNLFEYLFSPWKNNDQSQEVSTNSQLVEEMDELIASVASPIVVNITEIDNSEIITSSGGRSSGLTSADLQMLRIG